MFSQDLETFVHHQAGILQEKSATIDTQSALIRQLREESGVSLYSLPFNWIVNTSRHK